jgi:hypothetical protein
MAKITYYYTPDGTQTLGPVDADGLRRLASQGVLKEGSFICLAGESEWQPFDLAVFSKLTAAPKASKKTREVRVDDDDTGEQGIIPLLLNIVAALAGAASVILTLVIVGSNAESNGTTANGWYVLGGSMLFFVAIPYWFSMLFKRLTRIVVRTLIIVFLALMCPFILHFLGFFPFTSQ